MGEGWPWKDSMGRGGSWGGESGHAGLHTVVVWPVTPAVFAAPLKERLDAMCSYQCAAEVRKQRGTLRVYMSLTC